MEKSYIEEIRLGRELVNTLCVEQEKGMLFSIEVVKKLNEMLDFYRKQQESEIM